MDAVMVVDMGTHMLHRVAGLHPIVQILPPGMEERARALPPLISTYATPGQFSACLSPTGRHCCKLMRQQGSVSWLSVSQ